MRCRLGLGSALHESNFPHHRGVITAPVIIPACDTWHAWHFLAWHVALHALDAKYGASDLFDIDASLRLATAVSVRNASFGSEVGTWGQEYKFSSFPDDIVENRRDLPYLRKRHSVFEAVQKVNDGHLLSDSFGGVGKSVSTREVAEELQIRKVADPPELDEILYAQENLPGCTRDSITQWLTKVYHTSRGFEFGTFDSLILATTMKPQPPKWTKLAVRHVSDVVSIAHNFVTKLLALVCTEERVTRELLSTLSDGLTGRYITALNHVHFLLGVERVGTPLTLNRYFNDSLEKW